MTHCKKHTWIAGKYKPVFNTGKEKVDLVSFQVTELLCINCKKKMTVENITLEKVTLKKVELEEKTTITTEKYTKE